MSIIKNGKFITFEGGEGCGKSTQSNMLYQYLLSKNIPVDLTREVGGTILSEKMREILIYQELLPMSELLQIMAARYEHVHKRILPKLNSGVWVICDRFVDSTACYQGQYIAGKALSFLDFLQESAKPLELLEKTTSPTYPLKGKYQTGIELVYNLHKALISPLMPDCTFWIDVKPELALSRAQLRGNNNKFENKNIDFHQKIYNSFQYIYSKFPDRIIQIPILTLSVQEIHTIIVEFCNQKFSNLIKN